MVLDQGQPTRFQLMESHPTDDNSGVEADDKEEDPDCHDEIEDQMLEGPTPPISPVASTDDGHGDCSGAVTCQCPIISNGPDSDHSDPEITKIVRSHLNLQMNLMSKQRKKKSRSLNNTLTKTLTF
jgi:hypothetical protein